MPENKTYKNFWNFEICKLVTKELSDNIAIFFNPIETFERMGLIKKFRRNLLALGPYNKVPKYKW